MPQSMSFTTVGWNWTAETVVGSLAQRVVRMGGFYTGRHTLSSCW